MKTNESFLRDLARLVVWYPIRYIIAVLPLRVSFKIIDLISFIHYLILPREKIRILEYNISLINPGLESSQKSIIKKYIKNHYRNQLFIFCIKKLKAEKGIIAADKSINIIRDAQKSRTGVIIIHLHFCIPQLALLYFNSLGYETGQIYHINDEDISCVGEKVQKRIREKLERKIGSRMFPARFFIRDVIKWLNEGKILFISGDGAGYGRNFGKTAESLLFGNRYDFPADYVRIAQKTGSILLSMEISELKPYHYRAFFRPFPKGASTQAAIQWYSEEAENQISKAPHSWHFLDWKRD